MSHDPAPDGGCPDPVAPSPGGLAPMMIDRVSPQLTIRAVITGALLGGLSCVCSIYAGLKVGMIFNMSIMALLVGHAFWAGLRHLGDQRIRPWGMLENNINQTTCSAAGFVASAGLVGPLPALTILTGQRMEWHILALWLFSVCLLGIVVAVALRRQMVVVDKLTFPAGVACAETCRELHTRGRDAAARVLALLYAALVAAGAGLAKYAGWLGELVLPGSLKGLSLGALGFSLDPSPMLYGVGGLIGFRAGASLLIGSAIAFGILSPYLAEAGIVPAAPSYPDLVKWLIWPGVTLMVVSAFVSLALSWRSVVSALADVLAGPAQPSVEDRGEVGRRVFLGGLIVAVVASVGLQVGLFGIAWWAALLAVLLSFALALVAGRVSGETGITPVAPVSKIAQVTLGVLAPQSPAPNLIGTSVAGGAASQCAELLDDLKCGHLLGASPRSQAMAQVFGALVGALVGSAAYLVLFPDPAGQLLTAELPAPGVRGCKAVAELLQSGVHVLPRGAPLAMLVAAGVGVFLPILERLVPERLRRCVPSAPSLGLAFVFPASASLAMSIGGLGALVLGKWCKNWTSRLLVAVCTGLIVGETLLGLGTGIHKMLAR